MNDNDKIRMRLQKPDGGFEESRSSRRDLMKFFGIGAIITPLAGGAQAKLIEIPKAELIQMPESLIEKPFTDEEIETIAVHVKLRDGSERIISGGKLKTYRPQRKGVWFSSSENWKVSLEIEHKSSPSCWGFAFGMEDAKLR